MKYALIVLALVVLLCSASMASSDVKTSTIPVTLEISKYFAFTTEPTTLAFTAVGPDFTIVAKDATFNYLTNYAAVISFAPEYTSDWPSALSLAFDAASVTATTGVGGGSVTKSVTISGVTMNTVPQKYTGASVVATVTVP